MAIVPVNISQEPLLIGRGTLLKVMPATPMGKRWYALRLGSVPQGAVLADQAQFAKTTSGPALRLFHVGSAPQLLRIVTYAVKDGAVPVRLVFSEPVRLPPGDGSQVLTLVQAGKQASCQVGPPKGAVPSALDPNIKFGVVDSSWTGTCSAVDPKSELTVEVAAGFESPEGVAAAGLPYVETYDPSINPACAGGCWANDVFSIRGPK